jgi:hypothetical protein
MTEPSSEGITRLAAEVQGMVDQVTNEEFSWQDAHYSRDSRYGRETLFLIADSGGPACPNQIRSPASS